MKEGGTGVEGGGQRRGGGPFVLTHLHPLKDRNPPPLPPPLHTPSFATLEMGAVFSSPASVSFRNVTPEVRAHYPLSFSGEWGSDNFPIGGTIECLLRDLRVDDPVARTYKVAGMALMKFNWMQVYRPGAEEVIGLTGSLRWVGPTAQMDDDEACIDFASLSNGPTMKNERVERVKRKGCYALGRRAWAASGGYGTVKDVEVFLGTLSGNTKSGQTFTLEFGVTVAVSDMRSPKVIRSGWHPASVVCFCLGGSYVSANPEDRGWIAAACVLENIRQLSTASTMNSLVLPLREAVFRCIRQQKAERHAEYLRMRKESSREQERLGGGRGAVHDALGAPIQQAAVRTDALSTVPSCPSEDTRHGRQAGESRTLDGEDCVVCLSEPKTMVLVPCGHACVCEDCASTLEASGAECPLCRQSPSMFVRVYF